MKKSTKKKIYGAVIGIVVIFILAALFWTGIETEPKFKFLNGYETLNKIDEESRSASEFKNILYFCSFAADFNDIYEKANNELSGLGFILSDYTDSRPRKRTYEWRHPESNESVIIRENHNLEIYKDEKDPERLRPNHEFREGWNTVIVIQSKKKNRLVYHLDMLLNKFQN